MNKFGLIVQEVLPEKLQEHFKEVHAEVLEEAMQDGWASDTIVRNALGCTGLFLLGTFTMTSYVNAVVYVSYRSLGLSGTEAYKKTFPVRTKKLIATDKDVTAYSGAYATTLAATEMLKMVSTHSNLFNAKVKQDTIIKLQSIVQCSEDADLVLKASETLHKYLQA